MKAIKYAKRLKDAIVFPYGIDTQFDEDCDKSFSRFLDVIYYVSIAAYVLYALILAVLLTV